MAKFGRISRYALVGGMLALPLVLLLSSVLTLREFNEMRAVYLRSRAANIAARLETLSPDQLAVGPRELLAAEEPALLDLRLFRDREEIAGSPVLESLWNGRELFRTEQITQDGEAIFRAYIPFHFQSELSIARIDLDAAAADFLIVHARHNVLISAISGLVLLALASYYVWSSRRAALLERRQLELEHLAELGALSAVLAHEIRNPLGTIKGFAQLAREKADQSVSKLLDPVIGEIRRLEDLVTHLLLYGRPQEPVLRMVEWSEIASRLEAHAREAIGDRPIRFVTAFDECKLRTDLDLLEEALLNLIRNSLEALGENPGEVRLNASVDPGGRLLITVEDDGPGLPASAREKLFEPFVTTKPFGTGLGLAIARKLVESLGGSLEIGSRAPRGTRAELVFPRMELARTPESQPAWKQSS